jgi:hypothetical protein
VFILIVNILIKYELHSSQSLLTFQFYHFLFIPFVFTCFIVSFGSSFFLLSQFHLRTATTVSFRCKAISIFFGWSHLLFFKYSFSKKSSYSLDFFYLFLLSFLYSRIRSCSILIKASLYISTSS